MSRQNASGWHAPDKTVQLNAKPESNSAGRVPSNMLRRTSGRRVTTCG